MLRLPINNVPCIPFRGISKFEIVELGDLETTNSRTNLRVYSGDTGVCCQALLEQRVDVTAITPGQLAREPASLDRGEMK